MCQVRVDQVQSRQGHMGQDQSGQATGETCRKYGQRAVGASMGVCEGDRQEVRASLDHTAHCTAWSVWAVFGLKGSPFIVIWGRSIGLACEGSVKEVAGNIGLNQDALYRGRVLRGQWFSSWV